MQDYEPEPSCFCKRNGGSYDIMQHIPNVGEDGLTLKVGEIPYKPHIIWEDPDGHVMAQIMVKRETNGSCCVPNKVLEKLVSDKSKFSTIAVDTKDDKNVLITLKF